MFFSESQQFPLSGNRNLSFDFNGRITRMYDRILVPTDGSTGTAHVALQAIDLAQQYGGTIYAYHVVDSDLNSLLSDIGSPYESLEKRGENAVEMIERMATAHDVDTVTAVEEGDPAESILDYADSINADVVVCGTHGRSGVKRHLLGSVAERLVRHAVQPVLTVTLPETDITVETRDQATDLVADALSEAKISGEIEHVERQLTVWVAEVTTDDGEVVVYLDPQTRRTSIIER